MLKSINFKYDTQGDPVNNFKTWDSIMQKKIIHYSEEVRINSGI
jgi:hypothetical protein